jgi:glycosyltransferase involved in cell wall biosynthesis
MRIVLSNASFKWGGVHRITELLAAGFEERGHDLLVLCRPGSALEDRLRGRFGIASIAKGMDFSPLAIARIAATLKRYRAQVVLTLMDKDLRLTGPAARMLGLPVIARRANDQPIDAGPYARLIYGRIPTHHIANSEATRTTLLHSAPWLSPDRVSVIYNGIDVETIAATAPAFLPVPRDSIVIGFVGRLETRKGVLDLLTAWPHIAQHAARAQLVIAGRGPLEDQIHDRANQLERVTFLGYRDDVPALLKRCDLIAVPSHWEGFGLIAAEAMAAGKPVVASNTSSLPEIVRDGVDGLLVAPHQPQALAEALLGLVHNADLRQQLGQAGLQRVRERFTHGRMVSEYERTTSNFLRSGRIS